MLVAEKQRSNFLIPPLDPPKQVAMKEKLRALVTGGTGFVGSAIARQLVGQGHEVVITGTRTEQSVPGAKLLECHLTGLDWCKALIQPFDVVFHQAANNDTLEEDETEMMTANLHAPTDLFYTLAKNGCKQFVYASSTAIYGDGPAPYDENQEPRPLNPYAKSKLAFEHEVIELKKDYRNANFVGLRYCNVYGPGECHKGKRSSMIGQMAIQMVKGKRPKLFKSGEQKRDWIYIEDVVQANLLAASFAGTDVFNCGFGTARSFNEISDEINVSLQQKSIKHLKDIRPEYIDNPKPETYQTYTECNMKKAADLLGFKPKYDLAAGISAYIPHLLSKYA